MRLGILAHAILPAVASAGLPTSEVPRFETGRPKQAARRCNGQNIACEALITSFLNPVFSKSARKGLEAGRIAL